MAEQTSTIHICPNPNCGYRGRMKKLGKGRRAVLYSIIAAGFGPLLPLALKIVSGEGQLGEIFFLLAQVSIPFSILLAVIYCITHHGKKTVCPHCGIEMKI